MTRAKPAKGKNVTVRMYNVGFGDAFLLSFPAPDRPRWVLVDCGVHPSGPGPRPVRDIVADIVEDVKDGGRARIDVVIATHRHADHISGFANALWNEVEVGEVWLPWVEDEGDAEARQIRDSIRRLAFALSNDDRVSAKARDLALNSLSNDDAMETLHRGFKKRGRKEPRFLPPRVRSKASFTTKALPGVTTHVMGPSYDPAIIALMNPPKGEAYLRAANANDAARLGSRKSRRAGSGNATSTPVQHRLPFGATWTHAPDALPPYIDPVDAQTLARLRQLTSPDDLAAAASLEGAVNNTSLVIAFEIGRAVLLFPGDAQWGTWQSIAEDDVWRELVARTTFYKVSHHGSHNATMPAIVEGLEKKFLGMVSTRAKTKNWDIPRGPLLEALREKSAVVRSDEEDVNDPKSCTRDEDNYFVDAKVPF